MCGSLCWDVRHVQTSKCHWHWKKFLCAFCSFIIFDINWWHYFFFLWAVELEEIENLSNCATVLTRLFYRRGSTRHQVSLSEISTCTADDSTAIKVTHQHTCPSADFEITSALTKGLTTAAERMQGLVPCRRRSNLSCRSKARYCQSFLVSQNFWTRFAETADPWYKPSDPSSAQIFFYIRGHWETCDNTYHFFKSGPVLRTSRAILGIPFVDISYRICSTDSFFNTSIQIFQTANEKC